MKYGQEIPQNILEEMNSIDAKISIIIPCYNSESTIERTLLSVFRQDYDNIEVIVIDGASQDNTMEVLMQFESRITKIIGESDNGIYDAINKGVKLATGELVGMISSNDWLNEGTIKNLLSNYTKYPDADIYHANILKIKDLNGKQYIKERKGESPDRLCHRMSIRHPSCFVKREWYERHTYDTRYKIAGDYEFLLRSKLDNANFQYCDEAYVIMSDGGMSTTFRTTIETVKIQIQYHYYKEAVILLIMRVFLLLKSRFLRVIANLLLPSSRLEKLEDKKWNGKIYNN